MIHYHTDTEHSVIVEFHDTNTHHTLHVGNSHSRYKLGALSCSAALLASRGDADADDDDDFDSLNTNRFGVVVV